VLVSPDLVNRHLTSDRLNRMFKLLSQDEVVQAYLRMSNIMAVSRLLYNDHGPVHSRITAGSALEMLSLLMEAGVEPSVVKDGVGDYEDAKLVVLAGAYLHDIGNAVHRELHHVHGCYIASSILERLLPKVYSGDGVKVAQLKSEILHCVFSHDEEVECLSVEAGVVKVADGTDMAGGRARIPYRIGKVDIHSLSALAIDSVEIERGSKTPVLIKVNMANPAGVFQVEVVLGRKLETSRLKGYVEVEVLEGGRRLKVLGAS